MSLLSLESVRLSYGTKPLLEDVTFVLEDGEKMGVIGANGAGKTTLLRLVAGQEKADAGRILVTPGRRVAYLPQQPPFNPEQTVLDAVFDEGDEAMRLLHDYEAALVALDASGGTDIAALTRVTDLSHRLDVTGGWDLEADAKAILSRLGLTDMAALVGTLSGGQRKRIALARVLVLHPDLLILDEPTNHLDADTVAWLESYLARYTGALLLVTHDRYFLDRVTNKMLEIDRGRVQRYEGNYTRYLELKDLQAEQTAAEDQKRAGLMRRELAWLRRGAKARTTKQKARVDRAETLLSTPKEEAAQKLSLSAISTRLGNKVVELEDVRKVYGDRVIVDGFSHKFTRGERVGIVGPNGAGKTTLLEMIAGRLQPDSGTVETGQTAVIGYYDQESRALKDDLRVIEYVKEAAEVIKMADGSFITAEPDAGALSVCPGHAVRPRRAALGRRAAAALPAAPAHDGAQRAPARRAHQRLRHPHARGARRLPRHLCGRAHRRLPRPLLSRPHRRAHLPLRGRRPHPRLPRRLYGLPRSA